MEILVLKLDNCGENQEGSFYRTLAYDVTEEWDVGSDVFTFSKQALDALDNGSWAVGRERPTLKAGLSWTEQEQNYCKPEPDPYFFIKHFKCDEGKLELEIFVPNQHRWFIGKPFIITSRLVHGENGVVIHAFDLDNTYHHINITKLLVTYGDFKDDKTLHRAADKLKKIDPENKDWYHRDCERGDGVLPELPSERNGHKSVLVVDTALSTTLVNSGTDINEFRNKFYRILRRYQDQRILIL